MFIQRPWGPFRKIPRQLSLTSQSFSSNLEIYSSLSLTSPISPLIYKSGERSSGILAREKFRYPSASVFCFSALVTDVPVISNLFQ
jgi:hypothetical protein